MSAPFRPREIFAALEQHDIACVAIGGFALIAHGVLKTTADVDLVPEPTRENLERLASALEALGAAPDGEPETAVNADLLSRDVNTRVQTDAGQVIVLHTPEHAERYAGLAANALRSVADGVTVTVAGRDDLIALKAASGRDRDLVDIGDLLAIEEHRDTRRGG